MSGPGPKKGPSPEVFQALERGDECLKSMWTAARICQAPRVLLPSGGQSKTVWYELGRSEPYGSFQVEIAVAGGLVAGAPSSRGFCKLTLHARPFCVRQPGAWTDLVHDKQGFGGTKSSPLIKDKHRPYAMSDDVFDALPRQLRRSAINIDVTAPTIIGEYIGQWKPAREARRTETLPVRQH